MKRMTTMLLVLIMGAMLFAGCGSNTAQTVQTGNETVPLSERNAQLGAPDRTGWPNKIVIALMPDENNPDASQKNDDFCKAMEEALGVKVDLHIGSEYSVGIEAMRAGNLDIMIVSPMSYYQAKERANIEPLVSTIAIGAVPYQTAFFTRVERDDINSLADLRDKTFAFVDPGSSSGYMYPKTKLVVDLDLDPDQLELPGYFFKTVAYSGKHDSSLIGVYMGDYDAATASTSTLYNLNEAGLIDGDEIKVIDVTDEIPNPCFIINADHPQSLKDAALDFFLSYDNPDYFEQLYRNPDIRYTRAYESDYDVVNEMLRVLNIGE